MLSKRVASNGKIYAKIADIEPWEKNPRIHDEESIFRRKKLVARHGHFRPIFVNSEGKAVGGNKTLKALKFLNENIFMWTEKNEAGEEIERQVDRRGQFDEVWITELGFAEEQLTDEQKAAGQQPRYKAIIDGHAQDVWFNSIEQIMIEYLIADNDAGEWDKKALAKLIQPHQKLIPQPDFKLEIAPSVSLKVFTEKQLKEASKDDEKKSKEVVLKIKFTPEQYKQFEERLQKVQSAYKTENITDLFTALIEKAEASITSDQASPAA